MKLGIYVIHDKKTTYMTPTFDYNDQSAMRGFENACKHTDGLFNSNPTDFDLYRIGSFDVDSGRITAEEPKFLCGGFVCE